MKRKISSIILVLSMLFTMNSGLILTASSNTTTLSTPLTYDGTKKEAAVSYTGDSTSVGDHTASISIGGSFPIQ